VILDGEQEKADTINDLADKLKTKIEAGTTLEDLKKSDEWKELREYGNIVAKTDANGKIYVERNGAPLISVDGAGNYEITEVLPKESNMLNVVWKGNGLGSVFRLTGDYNSASNTDVGSLKGILVARGSYAAKYTDIPKEADYLDANGDLDEDAYKAAIASYNKNVDASTVMMTQAQFDQLIHDVVVAINDVLCPNTDVNEENLTALLEKKGATTGGLTKVTVRLEDGTELSYDDSLLMLDELNASTGMDEDNTIGEALFNRKSTDRYTKATLLDDNGDTIQDAQGNDIVVYIYNQEYESNNYSLFTIDELEINEAILQD
jgi:flagellar hook-associated protein 1 FlgK